MTPKVSVLMAVYNGQAFLEKTLVSVFNQTHQPHEVIVVDDGSTDKTPELLARWGSKLTVKRIANGGVANARNVAMDMATGDWLAFVDHDDLWFKNKLERQVGFALKYPEVGFITSNYVLRVAYYGNRLFRHYEGLRLRGKIRWDEPMGVLAFECLLAENFVGTSSAVMIRADVVRSAGRFDPAHVVCEDYYYWLRCARRTQVVASSEPLFYKRTHKGNLSNDLVRILEYNRMILKQIGSVEADYLRQHDLLPVLGASIANFGFEKAEELYRTGALSEAFAACRRAYQDDPRFSNFLRMSVWMAKKAARQLGVKK